MGAPELLQCLGDGGFIQFHPALAQDLGIKAALFLGHALYWSRHLAKNQPNRQGWFYMTAAQWTDATTLTTREQTSARAALLKANLLIERLAGRPARMHYRVNLTELALRTGVKSSMDGAPKISWDAFSPWIKSAVSFYRPLASCTGSVTAGLYLSYLLQCQRASSPFTQDNGFFRISHEDARIALCLGVKTQRNARDRLKALGLVEERQGLCRVNLQGLSDALAGLVKPLRVVRSESPRPVIAKQLDTPLPMLSPAQAAPRAEQNLMFGGWSSEAVSQASNAVVRMLAPGVPTPTEPAASQGCQSLALLSKLEGQPLALLSKQEGQSLAQSAKLNGPFVETHLPFCRTHIQKENKSTTTTVREPRASSAKKASRRRDSETEMVMPKCLAPKWHEGVKRTLQAVQVEHCQMLLDELEGQMGAKVIHNPVAYLFSIVRLYREGTLELAWADKVAADRKARLLHAKAVEVSLAVPTPTVPSHNEQTEERISGREQLRALRLRISEGKA